MAMSKAATAVPDPADDDAATGADDTGADAGGDEGEDQGGSTVLLTVMNNHDGTYVLIKGDEDEDEGEGAPEGEGGGEGGADEGDTGMPAAGAEPGAEGGEDKGETFDSVGALLKGILDMVKESEANETGDGTEDDNFAAGFTGGSAASPARGAAGAAMPASPTMQQKY